MPRTEEQYREIRENREKTIMDTALTLFAKEGFGHVSIASLASHAGMSKGLMYNYFKSKDALLEAILNDGIEKIARQFDTNKDGVLTRKEFAHFIRQTLRVMDAEKSYWTHFFRLMIQPNVKEYLAQTSISEYIGKYFSMMVDYFRRIGFSEPELEALHLTATIEGYMLFKLFYNDLADIPDTLLNQIEEKIIHQYT